MKEAELLKQQERDRTSSLIKSLPKDLSLGKVEKDLAKNADKYQRALRRETRATSRLNFYELDSNQGKYAPGSKPFQP